jgi:hypothetical protein
VIKKWLATLPRSEIYVGDTLYLTKYFVGKMFGLKWNLHKFTHPDAGRDCHSHPWDKAYSFILKGHYYEKVVTGVDTQGSLLYTERKVSWFNRLTGTTIHRVVALGTKEVWTLFGMGTRVQHWGFLHWNQDDTNWVHVPYERGFTDDQYVKDFGYFEAIRA